MAPKLIGPYRILDALGSGGAGTVFRAIDPRTGDPVALKLLATPSVDARAARRLAREFQALSELAHPNVVRVFDTGVHDGRPFLTMELVEGLTLRDYLSLGEEALASSSSHSHRSASNEPWTEEATGPHPFTLADFAEEPPSEVGSALSSDWAESLARLPPATSDADRLSDPDRLETLNRPERVGRLKDAVLQLCEALGYIHAHGLVHRDLKPSNVMVDEDRQVRLMDFGLAKFLADEAEITAEGKLVGTYRYMSPEQILGEPLDARADLYSLGVILYELLAGKPPFDAPTPYALWQKVLETEPIPLLEVNEGGDDQLARIAQRLLRKEPDDRYQTAEEISEALCE